MYHFNQEISEKYLQQLGISDENLLSYDGRYLKTLLTRTSEHFQEIISKNI